MYINSNLTPSQAVETYPELQVCEEIAPQRRVRDAHSETWLYAQEALEYIRRLLNV